MSDKLLSERLEKNNQQFGRPLRYLISETDFEEIKALEKRIDEFREENAILRQFALKTLSKETKNIRKRLKLEGKTYTMEEFKKRLKL